jgi:lysophospholipase L1-like esterase
MFWGIDLWKKLLLAGSSVCLTIVAIELLLAYPVYQFYRGGGYSFYDRPHWHKVFLADPDVGYVLSPNLNIEMDVKPEVPTAPRKIAIFDFQTDKNGFRISEDLDMQRTDPKEIRVFALGGSTTAGSAVANNFTYPQQLEDLFDDPQIRVVNAGAGGYRSIHLASLYKAKVRKFEPDVLLIYSGWNDYEDSLYAYWRPQDPHGHVFLSQMKMKKIPFSDFAIPWLLGKSYYSLMNYNRLELAKYSPEYLARYMSSANSNKWQEEYVTNIQRLIDMAKADDVVPVLILFPSPHFYNASEVVKKYAREDLDDAGRWDAFVVALKSVRKHIHSLADSNDVPLVDVNSAFEKYNDNYKEKFLLFTDRMHPTKEGNKLIAEVLFEPISKVIKNIQSN